MRLSRPHFSEQASIIKDHSDVNSQAITNRVMLSTTDVPIGSYLVAPHAMSYYIKFIYESSCTEICRHVKGQKTNNIK